jgi:hypothetical protein
MELHSLSLPELKQLAKVHTPKIKHYYIMKKVELIEVLSKKELPEEMKIQKMKLPELREKAKAKGITNVYKLRRQDLVDFLFPRSQKNDEDDQRGKKHGNPKESNDE